MNGPRELEAAIKRLRSLRDGDPGVPDIVALGQEAVPALRLLLIERERSGLFEPRRRAAEALAHLGAHEVLVEFINAYRESADPIERLGDEAVINTAALMLARVGHEGGYQALLAIAAQRVLSGVIGALGAYRRPEAIPYLVQALAEDDCRVAAIAALRKLGSSARPPLLEAALRPFPTEQTESESSRRRRRSALELLAAQRVPRKLLPKLRPLVHDRDARVSALACKACLASGRAAETEAAVLRLIGLLQQEDWALSNEVENCLALHFDLAKETLRAIVENRASPPQSGPESALSALARIKARAEAARGTRSSGGP